MSELKQTIQLLRSSKLYDNRTAAIQALDNVAWKPGLPAVVRYNNNPPVVAGTEESTDYRILVAIGNVNAGSEVPGVATAKYDLIYDESDLAKVVKLLAALTDKITKQEITIETSGKTYTFKKGGEAIATIALPEGISDTGKVTVEHIGGSLTWTIKQGESIVGTITIPQDMVVKSGAVVKGTWDEDRTKFTEGAGSDVALKLILNAAEDGPIYIDVKSLIDVYTAGKGLSVLGNKFSIVLDSSSDAGYLSVGPDGLKLTGIKDIATKVTTLETNYGELSETVKDLQTIGNAATENIAKITTAVGKTAGEPGWGLGENQEWTSPSDKNYINGATSVVDAIDKLDTQLKSGTTNVVASPKSSAELTVTKSDNTYTVELVGIDGGTFE